MKVLIVASYNKGRYAPFIIEQAAALAAAGCDVDYFGVTGKGLRGYLKSFPKLKSAIRSKSPDVIHAHYGLCGLLANLQRKVPVVTTYHGSDINVKSVLPFSRMAMGLSRFNIFVSQRTMDIGRPCKNFAIVPCGVDITDLQTTAKDEARRRMSLEPGRKYVLFAGAFDNTVKNYPLAKRAMDRCQKSELIELKGYSREEVTLLMCAVDALLVTSFTEGSPQVVKEALACGCPVVCVDVGDAKSIISGVEGCAIVPRDPASIAESIDKAIKHGPVPEGRERLVALGLTNDIIAKRINSIYESII